MGPDLRLLCVTTDWSLLSSLLATRGRPPCRRRPAPAGQGAPCGTLRPYKPGDNKYFLLNCPIFGADNSDWGGTISSVICQTHKLLHWPGQYLGQCFVRYRGRTFQYFDFWLKWYQGPQISVMIVSWFSFSCRAPPHGLCILHLFTAPKQYP